jgi:hypothetical protein
MQTIFIVVAAGFSGGLLFILLQPALTRLGVVLIGKSRRLSPTQKQRLLAYLQPQASADPQGDWALLAIYTVSLAAEIYFLKIGTAGNARAILVGMFLMLFVRSITHAIHVEQTPSHD